MATTTRGTPPSDYGEEKQKRLLDTLNRSGVGLIGDITKALPVGVGGRLQRSWVITMATMENPRVSIGTNSTYFLSLELGRKPGSGISAQGQESVTLWARRKLKLPENEARGLAYVLSRKYKLEGRPAAGLIGLAVPGASGGQPLPNSLDKTVQGSILFKALQDLKSEISKA